MTNDLAVLEDYIQRCSNWGRWGPDDQLGTVNLITPDKIREAAALVKVGKTISLTMPYDENGPQTGYLGRANPHLYQLTSGPGYLVGEQQRVETDTLAQWRESTGQPTAGYYDDVLVMPTQSGTQWDALCHFFWRGQMYNGHWAGDAGTSGSRSNGVQNYTGKIITRGVFVDLAEYRGVDTLEPGYAITTDDLDEYLAAKNLEIRPGDALSASVTFSGTDTYTLVLKNLSRGWTHTIVKHEAGLARSSAEVITEAPSSSSGVLPLADFGTVLYSSCRVSGISLRKLGPTRIVMIDAGGLAKDSTSVIGSGNKFHNTWIRSN